MVLERKIRYRKKLLEAFANYTNMLVISIDFVGSKQLQQVRMATRGQAIIILGKNTLLRKVVRDLIEEGNTKLEVLLPLIKGNMGLIFTNNDLKQLRDEVTSNKVPAAAKAGVIAPVSVVIPAGPTGLDPGQTSFFQALNIATKIARGSIEILNPVTVANQGERVSSSAVALLNKMGQKPFFFGINVDYIYEDGLVYEASILDLGETELLEFFFNGVRQVAALSMAAQYPTIAALPHMILDGFKKVLSLSIETDYTFEQAKIYKEMIADPSKFASAAPAAAADAPAAAKESSDEPEEEEEGFSLFD